jgi:D-aminopeptidase
MIRTLAKLVGYAKAPKTTTILRHPVEGTSALLACKAVRDTDLRTKALVAGAVAVPVIAYMLRKR